MTRSFYLLLGSLAAIGLVLLAQTVDTARPKYAASTPDPLTVPAAVDTPDAATSALDDLAAWPIAAGR